MKFVCGLRQVGRFLRFPPPIKLTATETEWQCNNKQGLFDVCLKVLNATFNNISVISWRSVLLVEETGENDRPVASHKQTS
jgi:hypothetical protein